MLNSFTLNSKPINGTGYTFEDWTLHLPIERQTVYLLFIGNSEIPVPISSLQSTLRDDGQSFLQVVVPAADQYADLLEYGALLTVKMGFRLADGSLTELSTIPQVPLQVIRTDESAYSHTATLSGYAPLHERNRVQRNLSKVQTRSINQGKRRVRCEIDLFLRPGSFVLDTDGYLFKVGVIQHFVNVDNEAMEVIEHG